MALPRRNDSWPLSATEQRYYSLRVRRHHQPSNHHGYAGSSGSSSDGDFEFSDGPDDASANSGSSSSSAGSQSSGDSGMDVDIVLWPPQRRPSTMAVLTRFLVGVVSNHAVCIVGGMLVGSFLLYCSMAATSTTGPTTTATATPMTAAQHQRQELMGRLATDLQMLNWEPLQAFGVMSPGFSDEEVKACMKTVNKKHRYLAGVWHPDNCVYEKAGLLEEWQCSELYTMTTKKKDKAHFACMGGDRQLKAAMMAMWGREMESEDEGEE